MMRIAALFLWLIVPIGIYAGYRAWGTPHLVWSYTYVGGGGADPFANRLYITCSYSGWTGLRTATARGGKCGWVRLIKGADQ